MSSFQRGSEKRRAYDDYQSEEEMFGGVASPAGSMSPNAPKGHDQEKRLRREIANSNERRRMQSINAGFQSLKALLPHSDGEKLSKAAILQQTSDYISSLEQEKQHLLSQNSQLKRMLTGMDISNVVKGDLQHVKTEPGSQASPPPKRKKRDTESSDEGIVLSGGDTDEQGSYEDLRRELHRLRTQLEAERCLRMRLEQQCNTVEEPADSPRDVNECTLSQTAHVPIKHREHWKQRHYIEEQQKALQPEVDKKTTLEVPAACETTTAHSSMSRRNLETIVEAIRHLEGDSMLLDVYRKSDELTPCDDSEEKELSRLSGDDHDDKSDSGHDSPPHGDNAHHPNLPPRYLVRPTSTPGIGTVSTAATVKVEHQFLAAERYPVAAAHLLHSSFPGQFAQRPAVIVSNLS